MRALIVDPSKTYRSVLLSVLSEYGFSVDGVQGGVEALALVQQHRYDLICVSVELKGGSCNELCPKIRLVEANQHTPIVLLTSSYSREVIENSMNIGVTDVFRKQDFTTFSNFLGQFCEQLLIANAITGSILYAEDSKAIALQTQQLLIEAGHRVDHCVYAEEALQKFSDNDYDLVLTDLLLAGEASGLDLVRGIRATKDPSKADIPIVAVSSFDDEARRIGLFRAGVNDYAHKPIFPDELIVRINNLIRTRRLLKQLKIQHNRLEEIAMNDQLTNLSNRHFMMEEFPRRISQAIRHKDSLSLVMIDIDNFKSVNDKYGHKMGDEILIAVANVLKQYSREEDLVVRYGGEEFIILLDSCDLEGAREKAEIIRGRIEQLHPYKIKVTASFGVSTFMGDDDDYEALFSRADQAVYQVKERGRNAVMMQP